MRSVVLLHDAYGGRGGIAKFNRDLLAGLASYGEAGEVIAIPRLAPVDPPGPMPAGLDYRGAASAGAAAYVGEVLRRLRGPRPSLIVCAHIHLLPVACLLQCRWRAPLLLTIHGIDAWTPPQGWSRAACARRADHVVAVSDVTRRRFLEWSRVAAERTHVLPNCVDLAAYTPGPARDDLLRRYGLEGRPVILTVARLSAGERTKGVDEVMEVMPSLQQQHPGLAYLVVGDGDDRPRLEAKAERLGLAGDVVFTGYLGEAAKADHYRLADAFVLASRGEGFGIVLLEALACGIPCVASKLDGSREVLYEGDLVDPTDRDDLCRGILAALARPKGTVSPQLQQFSPDAFNRRLHTIVAHAVESGR